MANKTKRNGGGDNPAPSFPIVAPTVSKKRTTPFLVIALVSIVILGLVLRGSDLREWWLDRGSVESLKSAGERPESDPLVRFLYARKLIFAGNHEEALPALEGAIQHLDQGDRSPLAGRIYAYCGYLYARNGDVRQAYPYLKLARDIDDDNPLPHLGLGILLADQHMPTFARNHFDLVTQLDPNNVEAWYRMGKTAIQSLKAQQAIDPLKKAISLAPKYAAGHAELGTAYALQSQFGPAVAEYREASQLDPTNDDYRTALANAMAMNARSQTEYQDAAALLGKALETRSSDAVLEFTLGLLHLRFNNLEQARARFKHCIATRPTHVEAWYNLSVVEQRLGDAKRSEEARKRFQILSDIHTYMGDLEKKVAATPTDVMKRIALAAAYERSGNTVGYYWQLRIAKELEPSNSRIEEPLKRAAQLMSALARQRTASSPASVEGESPGPPPPPDLLPKFMAGASKPNVQRQ